MIVIGDIAGQKNALDVLIAKLPKKPIILLGDLNDRGWESREVIQWAMDNEDYVTTLDSNHGDMFVDWYRSILPPSRDYKRRYELGIFESNGGRATLSSYDINPISIDLIALMDNETLKAHIDWLESRPSHIVHEINAQKYLFSHAPMNPNTHRSFDQFLNKGEGFCGYPSDPDSENNFQWNRNEPFQFHRDLPNTISVFGHNSGKDLKLFCEQYKDGIYVKGTDMLQHLVDKNKGEVYGICMDTSRGEKLTALDLETMTIYHSGYSTEARMY